jgi:PAS domain S-box-containing protein
MHNPKMDILLIESDPSQAEIVKKMLAPTGNKEFGVHHVLLLAQGLCLLQKRQFDLALVSLNTPDCPGENCALSVLKQSPGTPVIALSDHDDEKTALSLLHWGVQDYLIKDELVPGLLKRSIRHAIQRQHDLESFSDSEHRYRDLFHEIDEGFCIIQMIFNGKHKPTDYRFLEINPAFEKQTGLSAARGKTMRELAPMHEEHWFETYATIALTGQPARFQQYAEQLQRWFDCYAFRFGDPENRQVGVLFNDITDRKRAEQMLRESERKFSGAFQAAPVLFSISSMPEGRYIDVNEEFTRILGVTRDEVVGRTPLDLGIWVRPGDRETLVEALRKNREVRNFETRLRSKDGSVVVGLISAEIVEIDGKEHFLTITKDITELRRAEEERTRLAQIVESSDDGIIGKTTQGIITSWNRGAQKIYGYLPEEVIGRHISLLTPPSSPDEVPKILEKVRRGESIERLETTRVRKDGRVISVSLTISPITDDDGAIIGASTIARDITERKAAEREIVRLNASLAARAADLETANRDLEAFNYTVAHDLRRPLNVVTSYCQAISALYGDQIPRECQDFVQGAYKGALRMNQLIQALLDFSGLALVQPRLEQVNLSALALEVAAELKLAEPGRQVDFRIAEGVTARGDANLLRMVLDNLLGNAWKYTGRRERAVIELFATQSDGKAMICVRDNGPGFGKADAELVFAPFQRLPGAEEYAGFGIGLATVERIIKRHGGRVWAEGEPGKGAAFYFTLPADEAVTLSQAEDRPAPVEL